jgi:hypothetical protein
VLLDFHGGIVDSLAFAQSDWHRPAFAALVMSQNT